jgi:hypothetical protein
MFSGSGVKIVVPCCATVPPKKGSRPGWNCAIFVFLDMEVSSTKGKTPNHPFIDGDSTTLW